MAQSPTATQPPVTEEAFEVDRQKFWSGFCGFVMTMAVLVVLLLIGMAVFLV